jgi:hypothetical protein
MNEIPQPASAAIPNLSFAQWLDIIEKYRDAGHKAGGMKGGFKGLLRETLDGRKVMDYCKPAAESYAAFKEDQSFWNGTTAPAYGSELYHKIIKGLNMTADIMPDPFTAIFSVWATNQDENSYLRTYLKSIAQSENESVDYDLFRADMLKQFGEDLMGPNKDRKSRIFDDARNNTYVAKRSDGTDQILTEREVADMMRKSAEGTGPNIVITANHAFMEFMDDLTPITTGYSDLIDFATGKKTLTEEVIEGAAKKKVGNKEFSVVVHEDRGARQVPIDQAHSKSDTVMIAAVNTRENNFLNLEQLFRRLHEIDEAGAADKDAIPQDNFQSVSPIAMSMVSTLLQAAVEDGDRERITLDASKRPPQFVTGEGPIHLRADAPEILRKALFFGFSKGGNDFRDGMRLLTHTLHATRGEHPMFVPAEGTSLKEILSSISVTVQSMNEKLMHPYYQSQGVSVTYFTSAYDSIAVPPDIEYSEGDPALVYSGNAKNSGHHPDCISENLFQHPYIMQHHKAVCASLTGTPAIRFILHEVIDDPAHPKGKRHALVLKTAAGTTDAMMEEPHPIHYKGTDTKRSYPNPMSSRQLINEVLAEHGLGHLQVQRIPNRHGVSRYELRSTVLQSSMAEDDLLSGPTIVKLIDTVEDLKTNFSDVFISSAVHYPCLSVLKKDVQAARHRTGEGEDWKDNLVLTSADVYDRNIRLANDLVRQGREATYLPEPGDLPARSA